MRLLLLLAFFTACTVRPTAPRATPHVEVGVIDGAPYRIDVPANWNGELLVYCHGYSGAPRPFDAATPSSTAAPFLREGVAVAQSAYSAGGYALREGAHDSVRLVEHFREHVAAPKRVWIAGDSLGGSITMMLMETRPKLFDGGLALCAPLGPAVAYIKAIIFDPVVLFASWFPDRLPSPIAVPADYTMSEQHAQELAQLLDANPVASSVLRTHTTARSNEELGRLLDLDVYILGELQQRLHGNAFDNRDTVYTGASERLNELVKRYSADPGALNALQALYTPTGRLENPLLAVRTVYDPLISAWSSDHYAQTTQRAGRSAWFAQQHTTGAGHCAFTDDELSAALRELRRWREAGERPAPGLVR